MFVAICVSGGLCPYTKVPKNIPHCIKQYSAVHA